MAYSDYRTPFVSSVLLHGVLLLIMFISWDFSIDKKQIEPPRYIQATLVQMEAQSAAPPTIAEKPPVKEQPAPEVVRPLQRELAEKQQKQKQQKIQQEKLKQEKLKQEKIQEEKRKQELAEKQKREQAEKRKADEALAQAMAEEQAFQQSLSDKQLAQSYADMIRQRVEKNWSRPPSAKQGMEVLLEIQLVPTGYVTGVSVLRSSGNSSFDESAQKAVRKAERFPEIKNVPSRAFEQHFRRFKMLFRVEDQL